ncbi:hypothetical protein [Chromobacterium violaceum]|uniref:Uncharacterized protein n=1 Tax=Chromobacterium violaceum TaxID=536 RepID=A0A202BER9_CHRVL|nr:hypothetical protein [Chromobacterium violaceum]OVE49841.1 hypothetical protein CBW21_04690 [Chromobacterium violaceum]
MILKESDLVAVMMAMVGFLQQEIKEEVSIELDLYRFISDDEWTDFESDPIYMVGSIKDDWDSLLRSVESGNITFVDLERLSNVLKAIGAVGVG